MSDPNGAAERIRRFFDAGFNRGEFLASEYVADDYVDHSPLPAPKPGAEGFGMRMQALRTAFVDEAVFGVFAAEGDLVAFTWEFRGVHRGAFAGVEPTGRTVSLAGINVERVRDGLIVEHWSQFDLAGLMRQLTS
ncbi:MAG: ester cyclase [Microbacteriaceae bacterium]|nr:ester cyclase [Microbacteriaceae bacterium]